MFHVAKKRKLDNICKSKLECKKTILWKNTCIITHIGNLSQVKDKKGANQSSMILLKYTTIKLGQVLRWLWMNIKLKPKLQDNEQHQLVTTQECIRKSKEAVINKPFPEWHKKQKMKVHFKTVLLLKIFIFSKTLIKALSSKKTLLIGQLTKTNNSKKK